MSKFFLDVEEPDALYPLARECPDILQEYLWLSVQPYLSEADADRLEAILDRATANGWLNFWISEIDHLVAYRLQLNDANFKRTLANQQAWLQEMRGMGSQDSDLWRQLIQAINHQINLPSCKEVQQHLLKCGFDPGPLDGVLGSRTQAALKQFQTTHKLHPSGELDMETYQALGLK